MSSKGVDTGLIAASAIAALLVLIWLAVSVVLIYIALPTSLASSASEVFVLAAINFWPLLLLLLLLGLAGGLLFTRALHERYVSAVARLVEHMTMAVRAERLVQLPVGGGRAQQSLARAANALLLERDQLRHHMHDHVASASASVVSERDHLAALMAELKQSVLVCNAQGLVLLYNEQAAEQLKNSFDDTRSRVPLGIGRSVRELFDAGLVDHALRTIDNQHARGVAGPVVEFVSVSGTGHMLHVHVSVVMRDALVNGYVLMLQDITNAHRAQSQRDAWLYQLTDFSTAHLASLKIAIDSLQHGDVSDAQRTRLHTRMLDEVSTFSERIRAAADTVGEQWVTRWPLQDIAANDFLNATAQQIESWVTVRMVVESAPDNLWLRLDSYSLVQALAHQSACLVDAFGLRYLTLRVQVMDARAQLDLVWVGQAMSTETAMSWELDPMVVHGGHVAMSVRDVITRHGAQMSFERERATHQAFFRWTLPVARMTSSPPPRPSPACSGVESARVTSPQRLELFDFDLFQHSDQLDALHDRELSKLTYTVFDTEATGLSPSLGDEIIQLGAVRIVNARVRGTDCIDQLVDPQRGIPAASTRIHGITQSMVADQPTAASVLTSFHAFVGGSVLVAHNAAFDMRLLELKQVEIGLRFDQPVLDTLLLASLLYPDQTTHGLEALASRLGVVPGTRHTALSDAVMTAHVFLKMLPMLNEQGITTLGQAIAASQASFYARLTY
jgi:DNA polymerase-3 subunit epsilon